MTEWQKLWEEYDPAGFMGIKIAPHDYMAKIKAEGDKLEAENVKLSIQCADLFTSAWSMDTHLIVKNMRLDEIKKIVMRDIMTEDEGSMTNKLDEILGVLNAE